MVLHPVAFAGWIGLLVTALNLLPVGQLDGGHVAYALFPDYHRYLSLGCLGLLVVCGVRLLGGLAGVGLVAVISGISSSAAFLLLGAAGPPPPGPGICHHPGLILLPFTPTPFQLG